MHIDPKSPKQSLQTKFAPVAIHGNPLLFTDSNKKLKLKSDILDAMIKNILDVGTLKSVDKKLSLKFLDKRRSDV